MGALEASVMEELWVAHGPLAVRDVLDRLQHDRAIAYTTVLTVLDNLHGKGLVARAKHGRAYRYTATLSREEHTAGLLDDVLAGDPNRGAALLHFVEHLSEDDVAELKAAIAALDQADREGQG
nr:BlaI/MecI/CopY family transcriptional regulator [Kineosporia rhizophila]